ncbi:ribonuclease P protein component [Chryseobacterium sp. A301]
MKSFSYGSNLKLKQKKDLALVFEKGKWKSSGNLRVAFVNDPLSQEPKIGVSVSKRYFKKAVHRNRIKRLLREAYRHHKEEFHLRFGANCFVMIFWTSTSLPTHYKEVKAELEKLCAAK